MEIEKLEENKEELTETQISELFRSIILGKDVTEKIKTSRGEFKIKFPRTRDIEEISRKTAYRLNGIPVICFDANSYNLMNYVATLDVLVVSGPDWYELAKKENPAFSWSLIPDQKFIEEVYALAYKFRLDVQEKINGNPSKENKRVDAVSDSNTDTQPGLFEGMSNSTGTNG